MKTEGLQRMEADLVGTVRRYVSNCASRDPFLRNFDHALNIREKRLQTVAEEMIVDIFHPKSQVSYVLIAGLPGSGKTTLANAVTEVIRDASLGIWTVERRSFSDYRSRAAKLLRQTDQWTKAAETKLATDLMQKDALHVMQQGPFDQTGARRVVIAEMPVYAVDEKERGMQLLTAISEREKDVPYDMRRARVNFVRPDWDVVGNAVLTRILGLSSGGSAEVVREIADKAFAGAMLFGELQPNLYRLLTPLLKQPRGAYFARRGKKLAIHASNIITLRMLSILIDNGLFGKYDTVFMNQARRSLIRLSRHIPQRQLDD